MGRQTDRTGIRFLELSDAADLLALRRRNEAFLRPFEPLRPPSYLTLDAQRAEIEQSIRTRMADRAYSFGIFEVGSGELIGRIALSNVVRGAWQNATLGYFVDEGHNGRGYCTAAIGLVVDFAFEEAGLHRVQAATMPRNRPSAKILERNGFRFEGLAPDYLRINGRWEDHHVFSITTERWRRLRAQSSSGL